MSIERSSKSTVSLFVCKLLVLPRGLPWHWAQLGCHLARGPEAPAPGRPAPHQGQSCTWASAGAVASPA